jgi:hypothetical protein
MLVGGSRKLAKLGLVVLMVLGALMLWIGNPVIWLWLGSQMTSSQQGRMGPYVVVAAGILGSTVLVSLALARLDRLYQSISGHTPTVRVRLPWLRSLRDERQSSREMTVLDFIVVTTAISAITAAAVWFFLLAGSPLPGG